MSHVPFRYLLLTLALFFLLRLVSDADGRQRGYGFVEFQSAQALAAAVESGAEEPFVLLNRSLRVSVAQGPTRTQRASREKDLGEPTSTIHIANYPMPGDDRPLRQMLGEYSSKIMRVSFSAYHLFVFPVL